MSKISTERIYQPFRSLTFSIPPSGVLVSPVDFSPPLARIKFPFIIYLTADQPHDLEIVLYHHDNNRSLTSFDILYQGLLGENILVEDVQATSFALRITNRTTLTLNGSCYIVCEEYL